jgi:hypothetical protein
VLKFAKDIIKKEEKRKSATRLVVNYLENPQVNDFTLEEEDGKLHRLRAGRHSLKHRFPDLLGLHDLDIEQEMRDIRRFVQDHHELTFEVLPR